MYHPHMAPITTIERILPVKRTFDKLVLLQLCQKAHLDTILDPDKIGFFGCVYKKGEYSVSLVKKSSICKL